MLAVGLKKRLMLFHYDGTDFVELKEVALAEVPLAASWAGNHICLACKAMCEAMLHHPRQTLITAESVPIFTLTSVSRHSMPGLPWRSECAPWLVHPAVTHVLYSSPGSCLSGSTRVRRDAFN